MASVVAAVIKYMLSSSDYLFIEDTPSYQPLNTTRIRKWVLVWILWFPKSVINGHRPKSHLIDLQQNHCIKPATYLTNGCDWRDPGQFFWKCVWTGRGPDASARANKTWACRFIWFPGVHGSIDFIIYFIRKLNSCNEPITKGSEFAKQTKLAGLIESAWVAQLL